MIKEFNSQVCTTKEQSERLLALGLKRETADMMLVRNFGYLFEEPYRVTIWDPQTLSLHDNFQEFIDSMSRNLKGIDKQYVNDGYKPAWSLDRLISMINDSYTAEDYKVELYTKLNRYDEVIAQIQSLNHIGQFNKEFLTK
jgi:hypothetical protein